MGRGALVLARVEARTDVWINRHHPVSERKFLLTTYWSESTTSTRCGSPALRHGSFEFPFPCRLISTFLYPVSSHARFDETMTFSRANFILAWNHANIRNVSCCGIRSRRADRLSPPCCGVFFVLFVTLGLELSDTKVYET